MPRIPQYIAETSAQGSLATRRADATDFGGDAGLGELGKDIQSSASVLDALAKENKAELDKQTAKAEAKRKQDEAIEIERLTSLTRAQLMEQQFAAQKAAPLGAAGFVQQFNEGFEKYREKLVDTANLSEQGRAHLHANLEGVRGPLLRDAIQFESNEGAAATRVALIETFSQNRNAVQSSPTLATQVIEQEERLIKSLTLLPEFERAKMLKERKQVLQDASVDGSIDALQRGGASTQQIAEYRDYMLGSEYFKNNMSAGAYAKALDRLDNLSKQTNAAAAHRLDGLIQDSRAAAKDGRTTPIPDAAFDVAYKDPLIRADKLAIYRQSQQLATDIDALSGKSVSEIGKFLGEREPRQTGEGYTERRQDFATLMAAVNENMKQRTTDPAGYAVKFDDKVKGALLEYQQAKDAPTRAMASRAYADQVIAYQQRMEMPQSVLPLAMADGIIAQFTGDPAGQKTVQTIKSLSDEWGKYWPQVYGQIAKALPDTPLVIGSGMKEGPAMLLSGLTQEKMEMIKKGLPTTTHADVKDRLDKEFEQARRSMIATESVSGLRTFNSFYNAAEKLATYYVSTGESAKDAAVKAFNDTIGDKYEYVKSGAAYVRIPKTQDVSAISSGMGIVKSSADKLLLEPLRSLSGLDEKQRMAATINQVRADGYWVTSEDERGALLFLGGSPVLDSKKNIVFRSWYALQQAGQTGRVTNEPLPQARRGSIQGGAMPWQR